MIGRAVKIGILGIVVACTPGTQAGYYPTIDTPLETRWSKRDFIRIFEEDLIRLANVAAKDGRIVDSPMRQRYLLIEAMGRDGAAPLKTWQEKLNYSAVLIRRGKAYEATQTLQPLSREQPENFLVWTHLATANFLSGNADFRGKAVDNLDQALSLWPDDWEKIPEDQQKYLKLTRLDNSFELERFRTIESYFKRLMRHRLREERLAKQKKPIPEAVDPIFVDEGAKGEKKPVTFLTEDGKFEVGRIARAEKEILPRDAVEIVEQLLIWMPTDQRLLWLLGEVMNASVMECREGDERNDRIRSTHRIFQKLDNLENPAPFAPAIKERLKVLATAAAALPPPRELNPRDLGIDNEKEVEPPATPFDWWRTLGVGFLTGLAVGMFAVWQIQETRRRRQARAAGHR